MTVVGELVKRARLRRGLTMRELSRISGVTQAGISLLESGQTKNPKTDTVLAIATALGVRPQTLIQKRTTSKRRG
jgi:transcriptional regulator with XRE-family HTH domain